MPIQFTKMHGLGNDFMVVDAINQSFTPSKEHIRALARRDTGIGFDQCLLVEPSNQANIDFFYRIFNADGQEVGQCGNGARCLARFVYQQQLTAKKDITVATNTTKMRLVINNDDSVTVDFGLPCLQPNLIPLRVDTQQVLYDLPSEHGQHYPIHAINVGNPHAITIVNNVATTPVAHLGQVISQHPLFPEQCNAGFMEIINPQQIKLRVYERGCGETAACGSGAVAAAVIGRLYHQLAACIKVILPGGALMVEWQSPKHTVFLTGPASFVYQGRLCASLF